jgi:hypothetical protein
VLAIGLLYPIAVEVFWITLQGIWQRVGLSQHHAFMLTLALPLLPTLVFAWWFGRRIRQNRL